MGEKCMIFVKWLSYTNNLVCGKKPASFSDETLKFLAVFRLCFSFASLFNLSNNHNDLENYLSYQEN